MANINQNIEENFNWDNIDTGNFLLDHSQNFFARTHIKYKNFNDLEEFSEENKENALTLFSTLEHSEASALPTNHNENRAAIPRKSEFPTGLQHPRIPNQSELPAGLDTQIIASNENGNCDDALVEGYAEDVLENDDELGKQTKNVVLEWSTVVTIKQHANGAGVAAPPKAYVYKDIYQQKKEEMQRKLSLEERKMREFHSRPVPNFEALHKQAQVRKIIHRVTCPITPATLKTSRAAEERLEKKRKEYLSQQEMQKPKPRSIAYLQEQPFKPKHGPPSSSEQKPFQLHLEQRVRKRREYNAAIQRVNEEKLKQVDDSVRN